MRDRQMIAEKLGAPKIYDVFISYRRDKGFYAARIIRDYLESKGLNVFMDLSEIHHGYFDKQIISAIKNCRNFILLLSEDALDNCVSEADWLRREIVAAEKAEKNVIPVMLKGFKWPERLEAQLPPEILCQKNRDGVQESQFYFDSMLTKIVDYMEDVELRYNTLQIVMNHSPAATTERYFREHMISQGTIRLVDMAFHAGSMWFTRMEYFGILRQLLEDGVRFRILLNEPDVSESIGQHMRMKGLLYTSFEQAIEAWKGLRDSYPEQIELRLCPIVLLRRYYSFHMDDVRLDTVNVKHYMYGNADVSKNHQSIFDHRSGYFDMYRREFEYIWERSEQVAAG